MKNQVISGSTIDAIFLLGNLNWTFSNPRKWHYLFKVFLVMHSCVQVDIFSTEGSSLEHRKRLQKTVPENAVKDLSEGPFIKWRTFWNTCY